MLIHAMACFPNKFGVFTRIGIIIILINLKKSKDFFQKNATIVKDARDSMTTPVLDTVNISF